MYSICKNNKKIFKKNIKNTQENTDQFSRNREVHEADQVPLFVMLKL